jgi:uncharacterized protein (TIGR03435 family)
VSLKQIIILFVTIAAPAYSQTPLNSRPAFEVASIKPSGPKSARDFGGGPGSKEPETYHAHVAFLRDLIASAWKVSYFQIVSTAPLDRQSFDLTAKVPPGATREELRAMLQNLLAERFALKMHMESREFPAYELVVAKTGSKLNEGVLSARTASAKDGWPQMPPDRPGLAAIHTVAGGLELIRVKAQDQPLSQLASWLNAGPNDPPVVDKTGLTGKYTFTLEYVKDLPRASETSDTPPVAPDLATALRQQLGLQLVSKKLPFDVVVVESFSKLPTEN